MKSAGRAREWTTLRNGCSGPMNSLQDFRADKDAFFREDGLSPLTHEQRATFEGLAYYPENGALVVRGALVTDWVDLEEEIVMQTTTGGRRRTDGPASCGSMSTA